MTSGRARSWWRWASRLAAPAAAAVLTTLLLASPASAHATLVSTDPADGAVLTETPDVVTFTFSEPINLPAEAVQLYDARGTRLEASASGEGNEVVVDLPETLAAGTYVVAWRIVSADGHPIAGSLTFSIGRPSDTVVSPRIPTTPTSTQRLLDVTQGVQYAGLLLAAGLVAFLSLVLPAHSATQQLRPRLASIARIASAVAGFASLLLVPLSGARQLARGPGALLSADAWDTQIVGKEWLVAVLALVGLATAMVALVRAARPGSQVTAQVVALAAAGVAAVAPSIVGHTRAFDPQPVLIASDVIHLAAGATWFGGLFGLVVALPSLSRREGLAAETLSRFSVIAASSLGVLVAMGSLLSWRILGSWDNLFHTTYGTLLLVKIGTVAVIALVAAGNRYLLVPKVRAALGHDKVRSASQLTRRAVTAEAALVVGVLLLTGFLVDQAPRAATPVVPDGRTGVQVETVGDVRVLATIAPRRVGKAQVRVQLQDLTGEPLETATPPEVGLRWPGVDLGTVTMRSVDAGTYLAEVILPEPGAWELQVSVRVGEFENPVTTLRFDVDAG